MDTTMKSETPSVIPLKLGPVNAFLVKGKEKTVIVDTGYPGNSDKIISYMGKNSIDQRSVSLIVITHGHNDHYGSATELRNKTGAPVAIHRTDAEYLAKGINYIGTPYGVIAKIFKSLLIRTDEFISKPVDADIIFENELDLEPYDIKGKIIHTPGHTKGSCSLLVPEEFAIIGDLLMGGFLLKKSIRYPLFVNDKSQLIDSIRKIIQTSPKIIYTSHGGPFTASEVNKFLLK
jgi:glyoxylase-like metal-dependent hydrolase (beta-lactamase superfamily II)